MPRGYHFPVVASSYLREEPKGRGKNEMELDLKNSVVHIWPLSETERFARRGQKEEHEVSFEKCEYQQGSQKTSRARLVKG
jgi:hypothetical protein